VGPARELSDAPAFYVRRGFARDWLAILHPPYTAWHLGYVVVGGCLAAEVDWTVLALTVLAFFLALGLGAHALDELQGRPLGTTIPRPLLIVVAVTSTAAACAIGLAVAMTTTAWIVPLVVVGAILVPLYNLELLGGVAHNDLGFALSWGAFPVVTAFVAQTGTIRPEALLVAAWATVMSLAQRHLSTAARHLRRDVTRVTGSLELRDGTSETLDREALLVAPETALRLLAASVVLLAAALVVLRV
jgi:hypothetical protein